MQPAHWPSPNRGKPKHRRSPSLRLNESDGPPRRKPWTSPSGRRQMKMAPPVRGMTPLSPTVRVPVGKGRANDGSTLQEEAVLGGDPYPVLSGGRRARQGWRQLPTHPLPGFAFAGVSGWTFPAARCVPGPVGQSSTPVTAERGLAVSTLKGVRGRAGLAAVPVARGKGKPSAPPHAEWVAGRADAPHWHRAA